jgi:hypothetical protein
MAVYISSAVVSVDTQVSPKTLYLPPAESNIGKVFTVIDPYGTANINNIIIRALGPDKIDIASDSVTLSTAFESVSLFVQSSTNFSIIARGVNNSFWLLT